jgi:hypothetical protein
VDAVNRDWRTAPVRAEVKATLGFLEKLVRSPDTLTPDDARAVLDAGVSREALEHAIYVCVGFTMIVRFADTFGWALPPAEDYVASAHALLKRGYIL